MLERWKMVMVMVMVMAMAMAAVVEMAKALLVAALMAVCEFQSFIWRFSRFGENNSKLILGIYGFGRDCRYLGYELIQVSLWVF
jgi:hypothetical protein